MFLAYIDLKDINQWINVSSTYQVPPPLHRKIGSSPRPNKNTTVETRCPPSVLLGRTDHYGPAVRYRKCWWSVPPKELATRSFQMQGCKASNRLPTHKSCWKEWAFLLNPPKKSKISKMKWLWSDLNWYHLARALILKSQSKSDKSDHGIPRIYSPRVHQMIHVTFANSNWPPLTFWDVCVIPHPQKLHDSSSDLKVHLPHSTKTWRSLATTFLNTEELVKKRQWCHVTYAYAQKTPDVLRTFMEEGSVGSRVWGPSCQFFKKKTSHKKITTT